MTNPSAATDTRWRSAPDETTTWIGGEDVYIAFHRPSGTTHFLNAASKVLITEVLLEPQDASSIAAVFVDEAAESPDAHIGDIREMLMRLEELGLIERV